ncbi:hypothetical protein CRENPOLYSF2_1700005 [Crenothrix polyspora]|jgi:hypothetical protein|uniref:Uncharacterized protein n=1 Tax=Crenothrix polyspora TaxID=360316 RepID=A0A1R4H2U8_9GAMM|nr:hypothetical protein CRENPOLYSF2_1700005 [Crenothrix polyspora]
MTLIRRIKKMYAFTSPFEKWGEFTRGRGGFILKISPNPSFSKRGTERLQKNLFVFIRVYQIRVICLLFSNG